MRKKPGLQPELGFVMGVDQIEPAVDDLERKGPENLLEKFNRQPGGLDVKQFPDTVVLLAPSFQQEPVQRGRKQMEER